MRKVSGSTGLAFALLLATAAQASAAPTVDRVFNGSGAVVAFRLTDASSTANTVFLDKGFGTDTIEFFSVVGGDITLNPGAMNVGCSKPTLTSVSCPRVVAGREMRMEVLAGPLGDDVSTGATLHVGVDLFGEGGADTLTGGPKDDFVEPGAGLDVPKGGQGRDRISFDDGRPGPVAFNLGPGGTTVDGTEDDEGFEDVTGTPFGDTLVGDALGNDIDSLGGADSVDGFIGNDVIDGGTGDDVSLLGDDGDDILIGGAGTTGQVDGGLGTDTLSYEDRGVGVGVNLGTTTATDVTTLAAIENVRGSAGIDALTGDSGPNVIVGLGGADTIDGEGGSDTASFGERSAPVTIDFGATTSPGDDQHTDGDTLSEVEIFEGGSAGDVFRGNDGVAETFLGGGGDDDFRGGIGADSFTGGSGTDTVRYDEPTRTAAVSVSLTAGATTGGDGDVLGDAIENAVGGPAGDQLTGNAIANVLTGGDGNDAVIGGSGEDFLQLGFGDDTFDSADSERDVVECAAGNDQGTADAVDALVDCEPPSVAPPPVVPPPVAPPPAAPPPVSLSPIGAEVKSRFDARERFTKVVKLTVTNMPAGGTIELTCASKRRGPKRPACPFKTKTTEIDGPSPTIKLAKSFAGRRLKPGTVVGLTLTAPGTIGMRFDYTMRRDKRPRTVQTCVDPNGAPADC